MTFADKYSKHAYADLIREAETQGIGLGVEEERKHIVALMQMDIEMFSQCPHAPEDCPHCFHAKAYIENFLDRHPELIEGDNK